MNENNYVINYQLQNILQFFAFLTNFVKNLIKSVRVKKSVVNGFLMFLNCYMIKYEELFIKISW